MKGKNLLRSAVVGAVLTLGALTLPAPAQAAGLNAVDFSSGNCGSQCPQIYWENYTRSHTSTSDIYYTARGGSRSVRMYLRYTSNWETFASGLVGTDYGRTNFVRNWGATRFQIGLNGNIGEGRRALGSLYY